MRVLHLATSDYGGAGMAARRLNRAIDTLPDVESRLLVANRSTDDASISVAPADRSLVGRIKYLTGNWMIAREHSKHKTSVINQNDIFTDDRVPGSMRFKIEAGSQDIINLHWVADFVDYRRFFDSLPSGTPVVWTLHDLNPLTGGCHYALMQNGVSACERFENSCGMCPHLGSDKMNDLSFQIHRRKARSLKKLHPETTAIVASSKWLRDMARKSSLTSSFHIPIIPLGVNTKIFRPHTKNFARRALDLPEATNIILFVSEFVESYRKGFDLLVKALGSGAQLANTVLVAVGSEQPGATIGLPCISLGRINDERLMSLVYSAADVFVVPSRSEAFGQVVIEAMACGTPVIGFDAGGIRDIIRDGVNGYLAEAENHISLREMICRLLDDRQAMCAMSRNSRKLAADEYSSELQAQRYRSLYHDLTASSQRLTLNLDQSI